jgi:hypothetical protein
VKKSLFLKETTRLRVSAGSWKNDENKQIKQSRVTSSADGTQQDKKRKSR